LASYIERIGTERKTVHDVSSTREVKDTIMKKIAISLLALAALSTASFASYRDITTARGAVDDQGTGAVTTTDALVIPTYGDNAAHPGKAGDDLGLGGANRN
jgi:hypothetical protein